MRKVFITGSPHSGTSILKSKMSEGSNVYEQIEESVLPTEIGKIQTDKEIYLWKRPSIDHTEKISFNMMLDKGFIEKSNTDLSDSDIIIIMRNPYYVYTSISEIFVKKFKRDAPRLLIENFEEEYTRVAKLFLDGKNNKYDRVHTIYYEELFNDNYLKIRELMNSVGITYNNDIFEQKSKKYLINNKVNDIPTDKPEQFIGDPGYYRTWQINQPFSNFNDHSKINLPEKLIKVLDKSEIVKQLGYKNPLN